MINNLVKTVLFTSLALLAFAANSILCRLALLSGAIDAASFTVIRLLSGAIVLGFIINIVNYKKSSIMAKGSWSASLMLFLYATAFSFAYMRLDTGTGALILFGSVQITMLLLSIISGKRLHITEWIGVFIACSGFVYLILPEISTPSVNGFLMMSLAGITWGIYTLKGKVSSNPLMDTGYNFFRTIPFTLILLVSTFESSHYSHKGILFAVLSGGIASGIGYALWYRALQEISATQAAIFQLLVPVIAALGGVLFVAEIMTPRLMLSASLILAGIFFVIIGCNYFFVKY